jgi:hypothetical protein
MKLPRSPRSAIALAAGILLSVPNAALAKSEERVAVATTPHFAFHSDFATNLNDALIAAGVARKRGEPELFHSGAEEACFGELPPSVRSAWDRAVDWYAEIVSPANSFARQQYLLRMDLAGYDDQVGDDDARRYVDIARAFRAAASPAYEACRWAAQDAENRRWIEELKPRLAAHEEAIARRLQELYQKRWDGLIHVDLVQTVSWSGGNSVFPPPAGGHLLISPSAYPGPAALEIVFHEASHGLALRGDPLMQALAEAAATAGVPSTGDLWHVTLFHTTGEVVRRALATGGETSYTPMLAEIFVRGDWLRYRAAVESALPAYLDGKRTLAEAATALVEAFAESEKRASSPTP